MMGHGISVLLITSAVGYWTLTSAGREKGRVKTLGQYLGFLIIVLSVAGAACKLYCAFSGTACPPFMSKMVGKVCPMTGQPIGSAPAQR